MPDKLEGIGCGYSRTSRSPMDEQDAFSRKKIIFEFTAHTSS